jgi:hypothetical protein
VLSNARRTYNSRDVRCSAAPARISTNVPEIYREGKFAPSALFREKLDASGLVRELRASRHSLRPHEFTWRIMVACSAEEARAAPSLAWLEGDWFQLEHLEPGQITLA